MNREPVTIDNITGEIIESAQGYVPPNSGAGDFVHKRQAYGTDQSGNTGFGATKKFLDTQPVPGAPWLTPELAEKEMQMAGLK